MADLGILRAKKVLLVFGDLELGGAERQGLLLAEALRKEYGANAIVWGLSDKPGRLSALCDQKSIPWRGVRCGWGKYWFTRIVKLARFAALLRREKPDAVLAYTRLPNLICALTWRLSGARTMVWNQRDEGLLLTGGAWESLAARLTPLFASNSDLGAAFLQRLYGVPAGSMTVIRNGVTLAPPVLSAAGWRERLQIPDGVPAACMVANIHPYKDHHTLLRAWARVTLTGQPLPVLVLAGRIDQGEDELRRLAAELGIAQRVVMPGKVDDVAGLLQAVDLCVHSSRSEGLPNAVLEAMASGLPVVATDIPGVREAVGPEAQRHLAAAGDVDALALRIAEVLQDHGLRERLGQLMRQRAVLAFSPSKMCAETAALLAAGLSRKDSSST